MTTLTTFPINAKTPAELTAAGVLTGAELVPVSQGGSVVRASLGSIFGIAGVRVLAASGVVGDGSNERSTVQGVIDACSAAGGGIVDGSGMTVWVDLAPHPLDASYKCGLAVPANVELRRVTITLRANQVSDGIVIAHLGAQPSPAVRGPFFSDVIADGDGANQTHVHSGFLLRKSHGARLYRCVARNCRGTASSGANETVHFEVQAASDTGYLDCTAEGTAGSTASGFSTNVATGVRYQGCVARGMSVACGFTTSLSSHVTYDHCWGYLNVLHGFNNEFSTDCTYVNCTAGGLAVNNAGNDAYPYTAGQSLGNSGHGINLTGSLRAQVVGCVAFGNLNSGIVWGASASGLVVGGDIRGNLNWGLFVDAASVPLVTIKPFPVANNNIYGNYGFGSMAAFNDPADPTQPALAASTVAMPNPYATDAIAYVSGGTVTAISVAGRVTGLTSGAIRWPAGKNLVLTYSVAPTLSVVLA